MTAEHTLFAPSSPRARDNRGDLIIVAKRGADPEIEKLVRSPHKDAGLNCCLHHRSMTVLDVELGTFRNAEYEILQVRDVD